MIYLFIHTLIARCLSLFFFWIPEVVVRKKFECKNKEDAGSKSFALNGKKADFCFEFSSEGEFAQVSSLIEDALAQGKLIELVLFSPSVEKQVINLYERYPEQVRYLRYPILTFRFWCRELCFTRWVTSSVLYLVRYDFFPEFLLWGKKDGHSLKILWLSFKKDRLKNKEISFLKKQFLRASSLNVFATQEDLDYVKPLGFSGLVYDFRMEQIFRRHQNRMTKFNQVFKNHQGIISHLNTFPRKLIVGNAWVEDLHLLEHLPEDMAVLIVPHKLDDQNLKAFELELDKLGFDSQIIDDNTHNFKAPILILNKKGVLCELYADFDYAYVGGGFGVSIHSILEPLVNGVPFISCGPVNHRSTEIDVAKSYGTLTVTLNSKEFNNWLELKNGQGMVFDSTQYQNYRKEVIGC